MPSSRWTRLGSRLLDACLATDHAADSHLSRQVSSGKRPRRLGFSLESLEPRMLLDGSGLVISEFLSVNDNSIVDSDGDNSDWIEILNAGTTVENLQGWFLTDKAADLGKWEFPAVEIAPGDNLVVFASSKDRGGVELHTNFKLSGGGEYLALVRPDLTVVSEYTPSFPPQVADVSYGITTDATNVSLVLAGDNAKLLVPTDDALDPSELDESPVWTSLGFDDAAWTDVAGGVGFDTDVGEPPPGTIIADSQAEFSNLQNSNSWRYGYWDKGADANGLYESGDTFKQFSWAGLNTISAFNHWDGTKWDLAVAPTPPQTEMSASGGSPAGTATGGTDVHWAIRRYTSEVAAPLRIRGTIDNPDAAGDGVIARVFVDGVEVFQQAADGNSLNYSFITTVDVGAKIDFALDAGPADNEIGDITTFTAVIEELTEEPPPTLAEAITTDIESQMFGVSSSAFLRIPFTVDNPASFDSLVMRMKFDGGYIAYLNGVEVARENSPADPRWDSSATIEIDDEDAVVARSVSLTDSLGVLQAGDNLLSIQGLSAGLSDADFLLSVELEGRSLEIDTTQPRYFVTPTPGAANGQGTTDAGPIVASVSHTPNVPQPGEALLVTATVAPTFDPVGNVTLRYRVMYGGEVAVTMLDNGLSGDGAAGDGVYGATIPGGIANSGQMIRYYVSASDTDNSTTRVPAFESATDSDEYLGTIVNDPSINSDLPVFHWFTPTTGAATNADDSRGSIFYDGEFYDNIFTNRHGQSTGAFPKKSFNFDLNKGNRFRLEDGIPKMKDFDLLTNYADHSKLRNTLAYEMFGDAGHETHLAFPVRLQHNGQFFSVADFVEDADERWLERMGLDPDNALYKMDNTFTSISHATSGVKKKTRKSENNADLIGLATAVTTLNGTAWNQYAYDNLDLPGMANYAATLALTSNRDCCHKNYYLYRDTADTGEWRFLAWDLDLSFGRNWGGFDRTYFDDTIYPNNTLFVGGNNGLLNKLYNNTTGFREMYLRRFRTLMDELVQPPGLPYSERLLENRVDELVAQMLPDALLDDAKWDNDWGQLGTRDFVQAAEILKTDYLEPRREFLYNTQTVGNGGQIPAEQSIAVTLGFGTIEFRPASGNQDEEFVQITNPNNFAVDISGWTVSGDIDHTFKAGTVIPIGGSLYLAADTNSFRARTTGPRGGQQLLVQGSYDGRLQARGGTLIISDKTGRTAATTTFSGDPSDTQQNLRVSEIMYNPAAAALGSPFASGDFEFIEIRNNGPTTLNLNNVRFTEGVQFDFTGSDVTTLAAGEYALVVANQAAFASRYDVSGLNIAGQFAGSLDNVGERLRLVDSLNEVILDFDYNGTWYPMTDGDGFSLHIVDDTAPHTTWDNSESWAPSRNSGGSPGAADPFGLPRPEAIVVNEVSANSPSSDVGDWIELLNTTASPIDIGGWFLSDDGDVGDWTKYQIPAGTIIPAGGLRVFSERDHFGSAANGVSGFGLSSAGERVVITAGDIGGAVLGYQSEQRFGGFDVDSTFGRFEDSTGKTQFVSLSAATMNLPNAPPKVGPVVINEIHYHPADGGVEFVELYNISGETVSLFEPGNPAATWSFSGIDFSFPTGTTLGAGEYLVISGNDPETFRAANGLGAAVTILGPFAGSLDNAGENIELLKPSGLAIIVADQIKYNDKLPWPVEADGFGNSLSRVVSADFGNDPINWLSGFAGGTPGSANGFIDPPLVIDVTVSGSGWSQSFLDHLEIADLGSGGFSLVRGVEQLNAIPYANLDQIRVSFNEDVAINQDDLSIAGVNIADYVADVGVSSFDYDPVSKTATWTLNQAIGADKLALTLSDSVTDLNGTSLDGEWTDGASTFSGDGTPGGDLEMRWNVLPADQANSGSPSRGDLVGLLQSYGRSTGDAAYNALRDLDGNGQVGLIDTAITGERLGTVLPAGEPSPIAPSASASASSILVAAMDSAQVRSPRLSAARDRVFSDLSDDGARMRGSRGSQRASGQVLEATSSRRAGDGRPTLERSHRAARRNFGRLSNLLDNGEAHIDF